MPAIKVTHHPTATNTDNISNFAMAIPESIFLTRSHYLTISLSLTPLPSPSLPYAHHKTNSSAIRIRHLDTVADPSNLTLLTGLTTSRLGPSTLRHLLLDSQSPSLPSTRKVRCPVPDAAAAVKVEGMLWSHPLFVGLDAVRRVELVTSSLPSTTPGAADTNPYVPLLRGCTTVIHLPPSKRSSVADLATLVPTARRRGPLDDYINPQESVAGVVQQRSEEAAVADVTALLEAARVLNAVTDLDRVDDGAASLTRLVLVESADVPIRNDDSTTTGEGLPLVSGGKSFEAWHLLGGDVDAVAVARAAHAASRVAARAAVSEWLASYGTTGPRDGTFDVLRAIVPCSIGADYLATSLEEVFSGGSEEDVNTLLLGAITGRGDGGSAGTAPKMPRETIHVDDAGKALAMFATTAKLSRTALHKGVVTRGERAANWAGAAHILERDPEFAVLLDSGVLSRDGLMRAATLLQSEEEGQPLARDAEEAVQALSLEMRDLTVQVRDLLRWYVELLAREM